MFKNIKIKWLLIESYDRSRPDNELLLIRIGRRQNVNTVVVQREMIWHTALGKAMWFPSVIGSRLFPQETGFGFVSRLSKPRSESVRAFWFLLAFGTENGTVCYPLTGPSSPQSLMGFGFATPHVRDEEIRHKCLGC